MAADPIQLVALRDESMTTSWPSITITCTLAAEYGYAFPRDRQAWRCARASRS